MNEKLRKSFIFFFVKQTYKILNKLEQKRLLLFIVDKQSSCHTEFKKTLLKPEIKI